MELHATIGAATSDLDDDESFANIYCHDAEQDYCFALSRFPDDALIEVMVRDQVNVPRIAIFLGEFDVFFKLGGVFADRICFFG